MNYLDVIAYLFTAMVAYYIGFKNARIVFEKNLAKAVIEDSKTRWATNG